LCEGCRGGECGRGKLRRRSTHRRGAPMTVMTEQQLLEWEIGSCCRHYLPMWWDDSDVVVSADVRPDAARVAIRSEAGFSEPVVPARKLLDVLDALRDSTAASAPWNAATFRVRGRNPIVVHASYNAVAGGGPRFASLRPTMPHLVEGLDGWERQFVTLFP